MSAQTQTSTVISDSNQNSSVKILRSTGSSSGILSGVILDLNADNETKFAQIGAALARLGMAVTPLTQDEE